MAPPSSDSSDHPGASGSRTEHAVEAGLGQPVVGLWVPSTLGSAAHHVIKELVTRGPHVRAMRHSGVSLGYSCFHGAICSLALLCRVMLQSVCRICSYVSCF